MGRHVYRIESSDHTTQVGVTRDGDMVPIPSKPTRAQVYAAVDEATAAAWNDGYAYALSEVDLPDSDDGQRYKAELLALIDALTPEGE